MHDEEAEITAGIEAMEAHRGVLSPAVLELALAPLRERLAALRSRQPPPGPPTAAQQLRQVSVLFVDLVDSTAMGQRLDPEDIHAVVDGALARFTSLVEAHRGRVLQYTGDGMLAAFGADVAGEDDAECAVRAALAVLGDVRSHASEIRERYGIAEFAFRAGVHTGAVLLGAGVDAEGSIRGAAVNIAARMEQAAPAGMLRISHATYAQIRGVFDVTEQPPIRVKGVEAPVRTYLVQRPKPRAFRVANRGIDGVETPMVGRDAELAQLRAAFDTVVAALALRAVTVMGEAGLGKSRLVTEFRNLMEPDPRRYWVLLGRAQPRGALQPYSLLRDVFAWRLQIGDGDSAEQARAKITAGLEPLFHDEGEAPAHCLGHLLGFDFSTSPHVKPLLADAVELRQRAFDAATLYLRRLAKSDGAPIVMLLDDLHWADDGSLAFVRHLLAHNRDTPLLLVMLARPALIERDADWGAADPLHQRIDLAPLGASDGDELAEALLQRVERMRLALLALITARADGNPFYMEEMVRMLIDDGVIEVRPDGWHVQTDKLATLRVPPTLTGVLQARLDALKPAERAAVQHAAVVGPVFWDRALAAIEPASVDVLPALLRKQLVVRRDEPAADGTHEYAFAHHLLQQVAYDGLLRENRRAGHARVGAFWGERATVADPGQVDRAACRALAEAHHHLQQADAKRYVAWFGSQFFNYLNAYAVQPLRPLAEELVPICEAQFGAEHAETANALTNLARVILAQGDVEHAEPLLRRALAIQERSLGPDHADTARTVAVLGGYFSGRGDLVSAEPFYRRALAIRERVLGPEHALTVDTLDYLANAVTSLGRLTEAETLCRRVLEVRERTLGPEHAATALALVALGEVLAKRGDFVAAEPLVRRALAAQQRHVSADHPEIGLSMWHLAEVLRATGRHAEAESYARRALGLWERTLGADHQWAAWGLTSLAELRLAQGDAAEAAQLAERALRIHERDFGADHAVVATTLALLARTRDATPPAVPP